MFPFARMVAALDLPLAVRCVACLLWGSANQACSRAADFETPPYLYVWAADSASTADDFLAVVDLRPASSRYAQVIATASSGARGTTPHHTEHEMPAGGILWANGFDGNQSFRFNLLDQEHPSMMGLVAPVESLSHAHSFARLPTGHVVMTFQASAPDHTQAGGIAEFDEDGRLVRWASAKDSAWKDYIRPYSIAIVPALDRLVTSSADMQGSPQSRTVQVWRFSDLHLLASIELPPGPRGDEGIDTAEPRLLADGRTVLVSTFNCGLYQLLDLDTGTPGARFIHGFEGHRCALPVVIGNFWVATVPDAHSLVVLDVSEPSAPREVSRLALGPEARPHWIAADDSSGSIVITGRGSLRSRVLLAHVERSTGRIVLDTRFHEPGSTTPGITLARTTWPHGAGGTAVPHGAVFSRAGNP